MVHESTVVVPPVSTRPSLGGRRPALRLGLMLAVVFSSVGCGGEVWVYVDNTRKDPMVVTVDGKEEATIAPGRVGVVKCQPGKKKFQIECGGDVLYSGTKELKESDKVLTNRKLLFNPDSRARYVSYTLQYGTSRVEARIAAALQGEGGNRDAAIRLAYKLLTEEVKPLPADDWLDVTSFQYVLTSPPDSIRTKRSTERRTGVTRVERQDHEFLDRAQGKSSPTEDDLENLCEVNERVIESAFE